MNRLTSSKLQVLKAQLITTGFIIYTVDLFGVHNERDYFALALHSLPMSDATLDEDWLTVFNWNAFDDFLWQGLVEGLVSRGENEVAIFLYHAFHLAESNPILLKQIIDVFDHAAQSLSVGNEQTGREAILLQLYITDD